MTQIIELQDHVPALNYPDNASDLDPVNDHDAIVAMAARFAVYTHSDAVFTHQELSDHLERNAALLPDNPVDRLEYLGVIMTDAWARAKDTANRLGERPPTIIRIKGENGWDNLVGIVVPAQLNHPENTLTELIQTTKPNTKPAAIETPPSTTARQIDFAHAVLDVFVRDTGSNERLLRNLLEILKKRHPH